MRNETIPGLSVQMVWRDERAGWVSIASREMLQAVLAYYDFADITEETPLQVENDAYAIRYRPKEPANPFPGRLTIMRKPRNALQQAAWTYAAETRMVEILYQDDELGMLFLDEEQFVPFSRLTYDERSGFQIIEPVEEQEEIS